MSTDEQVTKDLVQTLEDGKHGFASGAEKLEEHDAALAATFRQLSDQREQFAAELRGLAQGYGDTVNESGSVAAKVHRGWMNLKDALSGSDASAVLDVAEQGEEHAVGEYEKALEADLSTGLRAVVARQLGDVQAAHTKVKALRATAS